MKGVLVRLQERSNAVASSGVPRLGVDEIDWHTFRVNGGIRPPRR